MTQFEITMQLKELKKLYKIDSVEFDLIAAHVLRKSREFVMIHTEYKINNKEELRINDFIERREAGEPLAYLFGFQEFYSLNFHTNHSTLIPRPETELMVEEALNRLKIKEQGKKISIVDVGTGSGCIAIAITHTLQKENQIDNKTIIAIDIEPKAIKLARKNAQMNKVKEFINFKVGNLLEPINESIFKNETTAFLILANLPYLTPDQVENSPTIQHEPKTALISGIDGLDHYQELFKQIKKSLIKNYVVMCEIDDTQGASMTALIKKELPGRQFEIKKDLSGYDRLAVITN